tara:strand:- start:2053 stop:2886 length:834 start_codon:yes stop_codon:yes gene_type:complete
MPGEITREHVENIGDFPNRKHVIILAPNMEERHYKNVESALDYFATTGFVSINVIQNNYAPKPRELFYFGKNKNLRPIVYNGIKTEKFLLALSNTLEVIKHEDLFVLYVTGHGHSSQDVARLLMAEGTITGVSIAEIVNQTAIHNPKFIFADQCFGFDFVKPSERINNPEAIRRVVEQGEDIPYAFKGKVVIDSARFSSEGDHRTGMHRLFMNGKGYSFHRPIEESLTLNGAAIDWRELEVGYELHKCMPEDLQQQTERLVQRSKEILSAIAAMKDS